MTNNGLAKSYLEKAKKRLKVLEILYADKGYSDVVREAQEMVELCLKGMLRAAGIDPPKWHDVGPLLKEHATLFPADVQAGIGELAEISKKLRKEREFAFYGDDDFIPTEEYSQKDGKQALDWARRVLEAAKRCIEA